MDLISVTRPLSVFFDASQIPAAVLEYAQTRGTEVHRACAAYARGLPVLIANGAYPYFESFRNWFDRYVKRALFIEDEFADPVYRIKGHPDIVCELTDGRIVVVDYKTPALESPTWRAQLAAYCYLVAPVVGCMPGGMALKLSGEGGAARAINYTYQAEDLAAFVAALTAYRYFKGGKK